MSCTIIFIFFNRRYPKTNDNVSYGLTSTRRYIEKLLKKKNYGELNNIIIQRQTSARIRYCATHDILICCVKYSNNRLNNINSNCTHRCSF